MASRSCQHERVEMFIHRNGEHHWCYFTCPNCGDEWTEVAQVPDIQKTLTSEEIIQVHERLAQMDITFAQMLNPTPQEAMMQAQVNVPDTPDQKDDDEEDEDDGA